jgi:hypothetical protein
MQTWLKRWRWWLVFGLLLFGAAVVPVFWLTGSDPLHDQFRRIELGMTIEECDAVLKQARLHWKGPYTSHAYSSEEFPVEGCPPPGVLGLPEYEARSYWLNSGEILVIFKDGRVVYKNSSRYVPNGWELLNEFFDGVRRIVHL